MQTKLRGELRFNEPLSRHTSWRVGGVAKQFYRPQDSEDLALFLSRLPATEPVVWLGLGSNILVRDGGIAGTVISMTGGLQEIKIEGQTVLAQAGVTCAKLARQVARNGLSGAAFLAGIPGTVGGALAMNAGAHQSEIWLWVKDITMVDKQGQIHIRQPEEFEVTYRHVDRPSGEWFIAARFVFEQGNAEQEQAQIKELLKRRNASQPVNQPCAGSVFRNPPGDYAGRLIEQCGLKGYQIGGARVSEKHANFIVNEGQATAADIEALIQFLQHNVEAQTGIKLIPEVHIIGEAA